MVRTTFLSQAKTERISGESYEDGKGYTPGQHIIRDGVFLICNATIAEIPVYDSTQSYAAGDRVRYPGDVNLKKGVYSAENSVSAGTAFSIVDWTPIVVFDATQWTQTSVDQLKQDKATAVKYSDFASIDPQTVTIAQLATILKGQNA